MILKRYEIMSKMSIQLFKNIFCLSLNRIRALILTIISFNKNCESYPMEGHQNKKLCKFITGIPYKYKFYF